MYNFLKNIQRQKLALLNVPFLWEDVRLQVRFCFGGSQNAIAIVQHSEGHYSSECRGRVAVTHWSGCTTHSFQKSASLDVQAFQDWLGLFDSSVTKGGSKCRIIQSIKYEI